jgi:hypothetical protein
MATAGPAMKLGDDLTVSAIGFGAGALAAYGDVDDVMELNGWTSPQMLRRYGASARNARARRSYDRIMDNTT